MHIQKEEDSLKKIKKIKAKKTKLVLLIMVIILTIWYLVHSFNAFVEPQLQAIAKQHTGFAINNIVKEVLADMEYESDELLKVERNEAQEVTSIEYDSKRLNQILYSALNTIDESLLAAQDGKKDPKTKEVFYEDGILYEIPLGYFTKSYFLYDHGPRIKVRMKMLNDVTGEIKTEAKAYGINNTMIRISLVVHVDAQVITFMSSNEYKTSMELPLIVQVVNGTVPDMSPYALSQ
jgi:sporulation protein YunB